MGVTPLCPELASILTTAPPAPHAETSPSNLLSMGRLTDVQEAWALVSLLIS